jgi:16S rRNA (uracil1498-N3)-methyltransferase
MPRFYVPHLRIEDGRIRVEGAEVRHIRNVLRLRRGDEIWVFDGSGKQYGGTIVDEGPSLIVIAVGEVVSCSSESHTEITLAQSLLKGEKMDYVIQKATELGVKEVLPFFSSRSVPLLEGPRRTERHRRWERIAVEASKQCSRAMVPRIGPLQEFADVLPGPSQGGLRLLLWEVEGRRLKDVLDRSRDVKKIFCVVGPEGGLSREEVNQARSVGFETVTLGKRILRSETASLCLLSIIQYDKGDIG